MVSKELVHFGWLPCICSRDALLIVHWRYLLSKEGAVSHIFQSGENSCTHSLPYVVGVCDWESVRYEITKKGDGNAKR